MVCHLREALDVDHAMFIGNDHTETPFDTPMIDKAAKKLRRQFDTLAIVSQHTDTACAAFVEGEQILAWDP
ncbi:hypothetical protein Thiowin_02340 [Thiorhodovibrio winogradskyi]|uniref:Uncharacterized protein n=1 Tax=Thiorhodovibrio winogradskyi TaxID=77007 RepID=A0ABZ0SB73_9GAMM